jgi:tRNA G18 (ribose-2'-O)-methylase SpoU
LRRPEEHERDGVLVASNVKVVQRLLASRFAVLSALMTQEWFNHFEPALRARSEDIKVYIGEKSVLEAITGYQLHQGALAVGKIPQRSSLESLLENSPRPLLLAAVEGMASAENFGAVIRNCAAFGVHILVVGETCCSPYQRRSVAGSVGTIFQQPVVQVENLAETLGRLRAKGIRCLAAHPRPESKRLSKAELSGDCCLVFGAEGPGLTSKVLAACDETVEIPMPSHMNSINVASATAVFLYEATRQRA